MGEGVGGKISFKLSHFLCGGGGGGIEKQLRISGLGGQNFLAPPF